MAKLTFKSAGVSTQEIDLSGSDCFIVTVPTPVDDENHARQIKKKVDQCK